MTIEGCQNTVLVCEKGKPNIQMLKEFLTASEITQESSDFEGVKLTELTEKVPVSAPFNTHIILHRYHSLLFSKIVSF